MLSVRVVWGEVGKVELSVCPLYCALPVGCTECALPVGCTVHFLLAVLCTFCWLYCALPVGCTVHFLLAVLCTSCWLYCALNVVVTFLHKSQLRSLQDQLKLSQEHTEQYKTLNTTNESSLRELNESSEQFKKDMEEKLEQVTLT